MSQHHKLSMYMMKPLIVCLLSMASLHAESLVIPVVGKGWQIGFEGPTLFTENMEPNEEGLRYKANAGLFNISAFVEAAAVKDGGSKECRDHIWRQASKNPMIQKESIKLWSAENCECVEYTIAGDFKGEKFTQANINCFFTHEGKWVDVHASIVSPSAEDVQLLQRLAKSLNYGPTPARKAVANQFLLPGLGRIKINVPLGWNIGNATASKNEGRPEIHTLSFFSAKDPNKHWKMSFFNSPQRHETLEDIRKSAENAQQSAVEGSVEGKANLREIKLKQGVGCQAVYTDASLAGKPVQVGNAKVISSGFVAPHPEILGSITIFADDTQDADFKAAIEALNTLEFIRSTGA
jgi:hypothetical protein